MTQTIGFIVLYALLNVSGAALIKWQLKGRSLGAFSDWLYLLLNPLFVLAFLLIVVSALLMFKALSTNNFSLVVPLATGINFILTVLVGFSFFNDRISAVSLLGLLLILTGITLLSLNQKTYVQ